MKADSRPPESPVSRDEELERLAARVGGIVATMTVGSVVSPDEELSKLGIDSIARLELLARLEIEFDIELTEDLTSEFRTVNRIARVIRGVVDPAWLSKP